jgi:hypothetical protein
MLFNLSKLKAGEKLKNRIYPKKNISLGKIIKSNGLWDEKATNSGTRRSLRDTIVLRRG